MAHTLHRYFFKLENVHEKKFYILTLFCSEIFAWALINILSTPACPYRALVWRGVSPYWKIVKYQNSKKSLSQMHYRNLIFKYYLIYTNILVSIENNSNYFSKKKEIHRTNKF